MYLVIIILPLLGSIAAGFFGRKIGVNGAQFITCSAVIITTMLAVIAFFWGWIKQYTCVNTSI